MADTSFVSRVTAIATAWLQDVNNFIYRQSSKTSKATPVDTDTIPLSDAGGTTWKILSWANLVARLAALCSAGWNAATATTATDTASKTGTGSTYVTNTSPTLTS